MADAPAEVLARRYGAYLFDLDGTLVDSAPDINAALEHTLAAHGYAPVGEGLTRHWVGHGARVLIEQALRHHGAGGQLHDTALLDALYERFIAYYSAHIADLGRPCDGTEETLATLKARGAGIAVVTNKLEGLSRRLLEALSLARYIDIVIGGDSLSARKPDPEPAWHACRALAVVPADALFIGDSVTDVETARNAGIAVVCRRDGYNQDTPAEALGADAVVDSLTALL